MGKLSALGHPTRSAQPFIPTGPGFDSYPRRNRSHVPEGFVLDAFYCAACQHSGWQRGLSV